MKSTTTAIIDRLSTLNTTKKVSIVFGFSILYISVLCLIFMKYQHGIFSQINKPLILLVTWLWGLPYGLLLIILEFLSNSILFKNIYHTGAFSIESVINYISNILIVFAITSFRAMHYRLKTEINKKKRLEDELKNYQNHLEDLVKSKTKEVEATNERLRHVEKMEALGQLAGGIAHDFNNQLTCIMGYTELFKLKFTNDTTYSDYADIIFSSCKATSHLTKQLLAFARKGKIESLTIDIHKLIQEVLEILNSSFDKRISIHEKLYANRSLVKGDPGQLQNALLNLAINARDAIKNNGILTIKTEITELNDSLCEKSIFPIKPGKFIKISVADTGMGISKEIENRVFEPFFTTKDRDKGTGMGLAAVYGTIENHNGAINFTSQIGEGTTFYIYLPLSSSKISVSSKTDEIQLSQKNTKDKHIIVADDEKEILTFIKEMLEKEGYKVTVFNTGSEAIQFFSNHFNSVDIVILDMIMPDLNGNQTFLAMKKINNNVRALLMTGYTVDKEVNESIQEGALSIIRKPFRRMVLLKEVEKALSDIGK